MDPYQQVKEKLDELGISFDVVEHPPAFTTEQADSYIEGLEAVRTKSMFLTNKKKTQFYLLIIGYGGFQRASGSQPDPHGFSRFFS